MFTSALDGFLKPICISPPPSALSSSERVVSAGWGNRRYSGTPSDVLLKTAELRMVPKEKCKEVYSSRQVHTKHYLEKAAFHFILGFVLIKGTKVLPEQSTRE